MPDQSEFYEKRELDFFPAVLGEGEVREKNLPGEIQRVVITDRGPGSPYKLQAILRSCIHGRWSKDSNQLVSLIVVEYTMVILDDAKGARFSSMTTKFSFNDHDVSKPSLPSVVGYAPFRESARWNRTTGEKGASSESKLSLAPEAQGFKAGEVSYTHGDSSSYAQQYFDRGVASFEYAADRRASGIWWNMSQNRSQDHGIPVKFSVAMLVERQSHEKFQAEFQLSAKGGFGYKIEHWKNRFIRGTESDDPIIFDPQAKPFGAVFKGATVDPEELGSLLEGDKLAGLIHVEGLHPIAQ